MKLYVTQTRTHYEQNNDDIEIVLYGRTEDGEAETVRVSGFEPYFYVPIGEALKLEPKEHSKLARVEVGSVQQLNVTKPQAQIRSHPRVKEDMEVTESLRGEGVAKVVATEPRGVPILAEQYSKSYEADVLFTDRFMIDTGIYNAVEVPSRSVTVDDVKPVNMSRVPMRNHYFDIETDDRGKIPVEGGEVVHTDSKIVTIVCYDSYSEKYIAFLNKAYRDPEEILPEVAETGEKPGCIDMIALDETEEDMLRTYFRYVRDTNPDVMLAWNNLGFDTPYLIERAEAVGVDTSNLGRAPNRKAKSGGYEPEMSGRVVYDLMKAWKKMQLNDVNKSLDNAASLELGDGASKIKHEESIYELWRHNVSKLLDYNGRDVELMVQINESAGVMQDRRELKDTVGVRLEATYEANDFIGMLTRRMLNEWGVAGPTKQPPSNDGDDDYEGAYTFPAFEGRRDNVVQIDVSSLYPYTMRMLNSSPETLVGVYDNPQEMASVEDGLTAAPNGAVFDTSEDGLFRELVNKALELTKQAGRRRDEHEPGSEEWTYWNQTREARKRIRNCFTPDTEVLTPDGVQNIRDLEVGDRVYSFNKDTQEAEVKPVTEVHEYPDYDGDMYDIETQKIDFSVTPNHRMLVKQNGGYVQDDSYQFVEAQELNSSSGYEMPHDWNWTAGEPLETIDLTNHLSNGEVLCHFNDDLRNVVSDVGVDRDELRRTQTRRVGGGNQWCVVMSQSTYEEYQDGFEHHCSKTLYRIGNSNDEGWIPASYDGDSFLELLGWFITEGSVTDNRVGIAQQVATFRSDIADVVDSCGIEGGWSNGGFAKQSPALAKLLTSLGGEDSFSKKIPEFVFSLPERQRQLLFDTLIDGDGDSSESSTRYTTSSDKLRDDFMQLCVTLGNNPQYNHDSGSWRIFYGDTKNHFRMHRSSEKSTADNGVYCVSVKDNESLLAGRNGKFQFVGNSTYGTLGWVWFFLYDEDVAEAITTISQEVIKETSYYINEETEGEVVYGDTDSNYISWPSEWSTEQCLQATEQAVETLNNDVYPELATEWGIAAEDSEWEIEIEDMSSDMFQASKKKRYAKRQVWSEGMAFDETLDEPQYKIAGFEYKRSDTATLTKELQQDVIHAILDGVEKSEIRKKLFKKANQIHRKNGDFDLIGIPGGINMGLDEYQSPTATVRGAKNANKLFDKGFGEGDKPKRVYIEQRPIEHNDSRVVSDVLAFEDSSDLEPVKDSLCVDVPKMVNTIIKSPMRPICEAIGVDVDAALDGAEQKGLGDWV